MAFSDEVVKDGQGVVFRLDISFDNFSTITHRYATQAFEVSGNHWEARIVGLGQLQRGLGLDNALQTSSVEIAFNNTDELADWMCDQSTASNVLKARMKLYIGVYDPTTTTTIITAKQLGTFSFSEFPTRNNETVTAVLADDSSGFLGELAPLPTIGDWGLSGTDVPFAPLVSPLTPAANTPIPLIFGNSWADCWRPAPGEVPHGSGNTYEGEVPLVVCCTTSTATVTANDITEFWVIDRKGGGKAYQVPSSFTLNSSSVTIWTARKTDTITVDGRSFKVLWIGLNSLGFSYWFADQISNPQLGFNVTGLQVYAELLDEEEAFEFAARGFPMSARTATSSADQHPADIITDLVSYYSRGSTSGVNTTSTARVKAAFPDLRAGGVIGGPLDDLRSLPRILSDICASFLLDVFFDWDGKLALTASFRDYAAVTGTGSLTEIAETEITVQSDGMPSRSQRGAPFNILIARDPRPRPEGFFAFHDGAVFADPLGTQLNALWNRHLPKDISVRWWADFPQPQSPWYQFGINATARPAIKFVTHLGAINLELGDYFKLTWTRNLGDPYDEAIFQLQAMTLNPENLSVQIEALWADDLATERGYLLDDESLLLVAEGSGSRTITVEDSNSTATISSGDLTSDGVQVGDVCVLRDPAEAATGFKRNKVIKVGQAPTATSFRISDPLDSLDFDAPSGATFSEWAIYRSHVTYPTSTSDATNYPDGGNMYGRVSNADEDGVYSDDGTGDFTAGHKLLDG